jgi:cytochrome c-type biogenesis protein CcmE
MEAPAGSVRPLPPDAEPEAGPGRFSPNLKLLSVGGVILLSVAYLVYINLGSTAAYYLTVPELLSRAQAAGAVDRVRVAGWVVDGTVERPAGGGLKFVIEEEGARIPVVYRGVVPDIFGPGIQVVVEGDFRDGTFQAKTLLAKCPSKFESQLPAPAQQN